MENFFYPAGYGFGYRPVHRLTMSDMLRSFADDFMDDGSVDDYPMYEHHHPWAGPVNHDWGFRPETLFRKRPKKPVCWRKNVAFPEYQPEDIKVTIGDKSVTIQAEREDDRNGERHERKSVLKLPDDVNKDTVRAKVLPGGTVILTAEILERKPKEKILRVTSVCEGGGQEGDEKSDGTSQEMVAAPAGTDLVKHDKDSDVFDYKIALPGFGPNDVTVKLQDNVLIVSAKQTKEDEGSFVHREVRKSVQLPENIDPEKVRTILKENGELHVTSQPAIEGGEA